MGYKMLLSKIKFKDVDITTLDLTFQKREDVFKLVKYTIFRNTERPLKNEWLNGNTIFQ